MGKFWLGGIASLLLVALVATALLSSGRGVNVAATAPPDFLDRLAPRVLAAAVQRQVKTTTVTLPTDPAAVERGLGHYKENCLPCHGAPGVKPAELAQGMNPSPPELDQPMVTSVSDAELFWVVKNGIRMTGMPAFGVNHSDDELRDIVAFVRKLPALDAATKERLKPAVEDHHHEHVEPVEPAHDHHDEGGGDHHH
jgi:mono/diheme cytochrome c family protein